MGFLFLCLCPCPPLNSLMSPKSPPLFFHFIVFPSSFHCFSLQLEILERSAESCSYITAEECPSCPSGGASRESSLYRTSAHQFLKGSEPRGWGSAVDVSRHFWAHSSSLHSCTVRAPQVLWQVWHPASNSNLPTERGNSHCFGTVVTQGLVLSSASVLQEMLFPLYPLFLSHLPPIPIYFTGTSQGFGPQG